MHFRKKPVVIEATRFPVEVPDDLTPEYSQAITDLAKWCGGDFQSDLEGMFEPRINIPTLEGVMTASPGDWIIKGVKGEFYPIKEEIFLATYEAVTP